VRYQLRVAQPRRPFSGDVGALDSISHVRRSPPFGRLGGSSFKRPPSPSYEGTPPSSAVGGGDVPPRGVEEIV
jgi:hypothetical protein